jgi:hypothetical protein
MSPLIASTDSAKVATMGAFYLLSNPFVLTVRGERRGALTPPRWNCMLPARSFHARERLSVLEQRPR